MAQQSFLKKRKWHILGVAGGLIVLVCLLVAYFQLWHKAEATEPVTFAKFQKVRPGMSESEVVALLGKPTTKGKPTDTDLVGSTSFDMLTWQNGDRTYIVALAEGRVVEIKVIGNTGEGE